MSVKKIPDWFPRVGDIVFYSIGDNTERWLFRVDDVSRWVDGQLVAKMYGDTTTEELELCAVPRGAGLDFPGEWHLRDYSRFDRIFLLHPAVLRVYRRQDDKDEGIVIPQEADPYIQVIQTVAAQRELLCELGIPEDAPAAWVELPDVGDAVVVRFGGTVGSIFCRTGLKTSVVGVTASRSDRGWEVIIRLADDLDQKFRLKTHVIATDEVPMWVADFDDGDRIEAVEIVKIIRRK